MANWKEYTTKTTPEDADEIMIADSKANVSKRTPFSGLWNWIAGKLATAVISQLETQNKSIIPALNELNSNLRIERNIPDLNIDVSKYINPKISIALFAVQSGTLNRPAESTGYVMCFFWHHGGWCTQLFIPDYAERSIKIRTHADTYWSDWMNIK